MPHRAPIHIPQQQTQFHLAHISANIISISARTAVSAASGSDKHHFETSTPSLVRHHHPRAHLPLRSINATYIYPISTSLRILFPLLLLHVQHETISSTMTTSTRSQRTYASRSSLPIPLPLLLLLVILCFGVAPASAWHPACQMACNGAYLSCMQVYGESFVLRLSDRMQA
jgi:hypothetical protein